MNQRSFIKKYLYKKALLHPTTILPFISSAALLGFNLSQAVPSIGLSFTAFCGFLATVGLSLTRYFNFDEEDVREAMEKIEENKKSETHDKLQDLKKEMRKDRDTRTDLYANMLNELYQSFNKEEVKEALPASMYIQLEPQLDALFETGVKKLRESADLKERADQLKGPAAELVLQQRTQTLIEVKKTLQTLESSLQNLLSHGAKANDQAPMEKGNLREQFERNLERAIEIDNQMDQMISENNSEKLKQRYLSKQEPNNQS